MERNLDVISIPGKGLDNLFDYKVSDQMNIFIVNLFLYFSEN